MKLSSLIVKRRPVKKGTFRKYFANIARKKHRASTAASATVPEIDGDVPNLGIARALVVILIIHIVAIAGIFAHSHWFEEPGREATALAAKSNIVPARALPDAGARLPKVQDDSAKHIVGAGDTYTSIATANGVMEDDLRKANGNIELRSGRILTIPQQTIVAVEPEELTRLRQGSVVTEEPVDDIRSAPMVDTTATGASPAVLVKPSVTRVTEVETTPAAPRATLVSAEEPPANPATTKYTVKQGDTFWKIAQKHKTTPAAVMKANRITDAKKLRPGMQIVVP